MAGLAIRFNTSDVEKTIRQFKARYPRAVARALNRAINSARAGMTTAIARDMGLKASVVRNELKVQQATQTSFIARLSVTGTRIPLEQFGARGPLPSRGRGRVTVRGKTYPGAFRARMRSGHVGVFKRLDPPRLPIVELRGASLPHVFANHAPLGLARGQEALKKNLASELHFAASLGSQ